jgi:uncharacterized protein (DUF983 family)
MRSRLSALLTQRCPRCREGRPFRGLYGMEPRCSECGTVFEREPGYWLGALYFSYGLGLILAAPVALWMYASGASAGAIVLAAMAQLALWSPLTFRYARLFWLYLDQRIDPR